MASIEGLSAHALSEVETLPSTSISPFAFTLVRRKAWPELSVECRSTTPSRAGGCNLVSSLESPHNSLLSLERDSLRGTSFRGGEQWS